MRNPVTHLIGSTEKFAKIRFGSIFFSTWADNEVSFYSFNGVAEASNFLTKRVNYCSLVHHRKSSFVHIVL